MVTELLLLAGSLQSGTYVCPGNPDICDQEVRVYRTGNVMTSIKVEYVGYCGSMGPYQYPCKGLTCKNNGAEFVLTGENTYRWRNLGHPYECQMVPEQVSKP